MANPEELVTLRRFYETVRHFDPKTGERADWRRCRICGRPGPHERERLLEELEGRARMAEGRLHADLPLNELDRAALELFPEPRSSFRMTG